MQTIKLALAGVGNCASALIQGITYYTRQQRTDSAGLLHPDLGGYRLEHIQVVAAFDVDQRKVGLPLEQAIFAKPNCTNVFQPDIGDTGVRVQMGPVEDGVASHMAEYPEDQAFRIADQTPVDVADVLRRTGADVLVCYLPVGAERGVRRYAEACLQAGVAMVNCVPVFIASDPGWAARFAQKGLPVVGDDIKSQLGATIAHRVLTRLMGDRGVKLRRTYQLNTGGNTDFLNMLERARLQTKRVSKTDAVQSQLDNPLADENIHIGPSDYVAWQKDNKICFIRMEWDGFGDVPMNLEMRLSVEDSPNSGGVAIDAIRCAKLARDRGLKGALHEISAFAMKHPPTQLRDADAVAALENWIAIHSGATKPVTKAADQVPPAPRPVKGAPARVGSLRDR